MPDDLAPETALTLRQGDFLLSVALVCARDDAAAVAAVDALAELVSSHFRFWELVVVLPFPRDGAVPAGSPLTATLARYQNIRLLRTLDVGNFYRLRLAAVAESIGDVVLLTSVEEYAAMDLVGLANRVYQTDQAIVVSRPGGHMASAPLSLASMLSGYRINARDTQTAGYPRGWLSLVLARPDAELLLRFESLSGRFAALRREPAPRRVPARRRHHMRRLRLIGELMANSAPRVLRGLSVLAFLVTVMAAVYTLYVLGVWAAKEHLAEGWLTTNLVQSLTAGFLGIAVAAISMGIVKVFERLEGELRYTIVDEINNVDLFRDIQDLNVEMSEPGVAFPLDAPKRRRNV